MAGTNVASHVAPIRSAVNDSVEASHEMYATQRKKSKMSYNSREKAFIPRDQKPIKAVDRLFVRSNRYLKTPIQRKEPYCENNLQLLESTSICERIELRFLISLGALFA